MITYNQVPNVHESKPCLNYQGFYNVNERIHKLLNTPVPGISFNLMLAKVHENNSI